MNKQQLNETQNLSISEIETQLSQLRKQIIGKIKNLLQNCPEKSLSWCPDDITETDNAFMYYSDHNGDAYEGVVTKVWLDECGNLNIHLDNDECEGFLCESDPDYAVRSHRWLLDILNVMCEVLNIDFEKL